MLKRMGAEGIEPLQKDVKELEERIIRLELTKNLPQG